MITVGIPAYNEDRTIRKSIESGLAPREVSEVIVVASGSTDNTIPIVREMARKNKRIRLIVEKERRGKGSAVNIIFAKAKESIIVMTDADLTFPAKSISELLRKMTPKTGAVSGRPQYFAKTPMFGWWGNFASECISRQREKNRNWHGISGYLYAIRKGAIGKIPNGVKSEDAYIGSMVREKGFEISYAPKAIVNVGYAENLHDYLTQKIRTHFGHLEIANIKNEKGLLESAKIARGMRGEIPTYFRVANEKVKTPMQFAYFIFYIFIEALVWGVAFMKFNFGGIEKWKQIKSTKK
ncbi:glycosyltransferase [Candidatus Micrarchaeota archaeon]|nr:glycosyltransferase [Candidatus Micrarchaeota archaeon]